MTIGKPAVRRNPDINALIEACKEYIEWLDSDDYHEDRSSDYENEIFEQALFAVYGPKVFDWISERMLRE